MLHLTYRSARGSLVGIREGIDSQPGRLPWSRANAPIWSMTSGYASRYRVDKPLAFFQAFVDDSVSDRDDKRLFLAGYIDRAEKWAIFSDLWDTELRCQRPIKYLKMAEANSLRGEFWGWSESDRDEKLRRLAAVIKVLNPVSFEFSVSREKYFRIVRPLAPRGLGSAHFPCTFHVIAGLSQFVEQGKINIPIDFIFDQQNGVEDDINLFFEHMKMSIPRRARKLIAGNPSFRDDKLFLPLQAADMLAWHVRREYEDHVGLWNSSMASLLRNAEGHIANEIDEETLKRLAHEFSKIPSVKRMQSKTQWQKLKRDVAHLSSIGFVPPYGTPFKNAIFRARVRLSRIFRRD